MADALEPLTELSKMLQRRNKTKVTAHKLIKKKIALFADTKSHPGVYYTEYEKAEKNDMIFILKRANNTEYKIELNETASVAKISSQQFYQSLVDSTTERLITTVSRKGDKQVDKEPYAASYKQLLRDIQVLEAC